MNVNNDTRNQKVEWLSDSLPILEETLDTTADQNWPEVQGFCSIDWFVQATKKVEVQTTFHFCSDQTYISRATYIPSGQFNQLITEFKIRFKDCFFCWPQMTYDPHEKQ